VLHALHTGLLPAASVAALPRPSSVTAVTARRWSRYERTWAEVVQNASALSKKVAVSPPVGRVGRVWRVARTCTAFAHTACALGLIVAVPPRRRKMPA